MGAESCELRHVGFRGGTDNELTALHAVQTRLAAERGSSRMPKSLISYLSYTRNLPLQLDDHAWLVEAADSAPVAA